MRGNACLRAADVLQERRIFLISYGMSLDSLLPYVAQQAHKVMLDMAEKGHAVVPAQTLRTWAEQEALYAKGRTRPGHEVTQARGGESWHNYGAAVDFCFKDGDPFGETQPWDLLGEVGKNYGFAWGGDWPKNVRDRPHLEMTFGFADNYVFELKKLGFVEAQALLMSKAPQMDVPTIILPTWGIDAFAAAEKFGYSQKNLLEVIGTVRDRQALLKNPHYKGCLEDKPLPLTYLEKVVMYFKAGDFNV